MVEKKLRRNRTLAVLLPRVAITKIETDVYRPPEWFLKNPFRRSAGRLLQIPSPTYSYKKEQSTCIFHTELDIENGNIENAHCNCRDSMIFDENKRRIQDQVFEGLLEDANFNDLPPLYNLKESFGTQTEEHVYKFTCKICQSKFDNIEFFKHHQGFHSVKNYGCPYCNATFMNKKKLRSHLYYHLNRNFYECPNCRAAFEAKNDLRKHMRIHQERKWWACPLCPAKFDKSAHLESHKMKHVTPSSGNLVHVFRKIKDVNNMDTGTLTVPVETDVAEEGNASNNHFTCRKCKNLMFKSYSNLLTHEKIHSRKDGDFVCNSCGGRFATNGALTNHRRRAH